jgi:hypothetical protein
MMNYQNVSILTGFSVWLAATLAFSFFGHLFFLVDNHLLMAVFYLVTVPAMYPLVKWVAQAYSLQSGQRLKSAVLMALPGMIGDVLSIKFHTMVFPTLSLEQVVTLGSWVLWAYAVVLVIGLLRDRSSSQA